MSEIERQFRRLEAVTIRGALFHTEENGPD